MKKWIPNIFTALNLCCGVTAIMLIDPVWSTLLIIAAAIFDGFDGLIARKLGVDSELGKQLDSLADLITFGLAPAYVIQAIFPMHLSLAIAVVICASLCAALRLAKFNTMESKIYFEGLPSPAHGITLLGIVILDIGSIHVNSIAIAVFSIFISLTMIIPLTYPSFKSIGKEKKSLIPMLMGVIVAIITLFIQWQFFLIAGMLSFIITSRFTPRFT